MDETIEGYMALCICILCNVPPDVAFKCYESGRAHIKWTRKDMQRIKVLRQNGTKWQDIADQFCVDKAKLMKIYSYYKKKGEI